MRITAVPRATRLACGVCTAVGALYFSGAMNGALSNRGKADLIPLPKPVIKARSAKLP